MIIRCNTCGFVNGVADEETSFCPNCGSAYAMNEGATVMAGPPPAVRGTGYGSYTALPTQAPEYPPTPYPGTPEAYPYPSKPDFGPPPPPPVAAKPKGGAGAFVGGMLVMLGLVVLSLCGLVAYAAAKAHGSAQSSQVSTSALTSSQTPNVNPSATKAPLTFQQYSDPQGQFVVQYPATWHHQASPATGISGTLTTFSPASGVKAFNVVVTTAFLTTNSLQTIIESSSGNTNFVVTQKPIGETINGIHWRKVAADFTAADGASFHAVELVWHHAPGTYVVVFLAPQSQFSGTEKSVFQPMLQSFTAP